jgi:hypothetical protein
MQALSPAMILNVWEQGAGLHSLDQALLILDYGCPEQSRETLLDLSLGQRDRLLLQLYRQTFGEALDAYTQCLACQERLEFSLSCGVFLNDVTARGLATKTINVDGQQFSLRSPTSRDAAVAAASETVAAAKKELLIRCAIPAADFSGAVDTLPAEAQAAIAAEIALLDPQAELLVDLLCPVCGGAWQGVFEITNFLWAEIRARARQLLQQIDALARAYGWREADILAMSEARRGLYMQMALS